VTLYRAQYRALVAEQLIFAGTLAGSRVFQSRALPTGSDMLPAILLQTPRDAKVSTGPGAPKFIATFDLFVVARLEGATFQIAETLIEQFVEQIEFAVLCNPLLVNPLQQFPSVETNIMIDGTGKTFVGEATMLFRCEFYQVFDPPLTTPLTEIDVNTVIGDQTIDITVIYPAA